MRSIRMPLLVVLLFSGTAALLSIGLTRPWRLLHEDTEAFHTSLALSHLRLGLVRTRAHDLFYNPHTGESIAYGHHPPGPDLLLAAAFSLAGRDARWVARSLAILFHLGSLALFFVILRRLFAPLQALAGAFLFAILPMSSYFGRMMNYEAFGLFASLLQLAGWLAFRQSRSLKAALVLCFGIVFGGIIDWAPLFFAGAIFVVELQERPVSSDGRWLPRGIAIFGAGILAFDLLHLWFAGHGSLGALSAVLAPGIGPGEAKFTIPRFAMSQIETFRRYFSLSGLCSSLVLGGCVALPRSKIGHRLLRDQDPQLAPFLKASGVAALAYVLAAPRWANVHAFWQFYFLPFVATSLLIVLSKLWMAGFRAKRPFFRLLFLLAAVDIGATTGYMLWLRHTREEPYAVRMVHYLETTFLAPSEVAYRK